jgi:saccharopine dehydrogenase-like NADP-dependent oxidoreductase
MSQKIFIIGAGRSASSLIKYLSDESENNNFKIRVGDQNLDLLKSKIHSSSRVEAIHFDVLDPVQRANEIKVADIVISMLPAHLHFTVAQDCVKFSKNLVTASYVSNDIKSLDKEAKNKGIILLNEIGLDPGIDHMSAMKVIDQIKSVGGVLKSFKSYCGGLVAPESVSSPWQYKFTWNPKNVILAGQGIAKYIKNGKYKYIPYHRLFKRTEKLSILDQGEFEAYANRDSLSYREVYGLNNIPTLLRGTLRRPGYCQSWDLFVELGMTDDSYQMDVSGMTYLDFLNSFLRKTKNSSQEHLKNYFGVTDSVLLKLDWLGLFGETKINVQTASPAHILQIILESKWALGEDDIDMIVMQHQFIYIIDGEEREIHSSFVTYGEDQIFTGMSKTVGLPVGIAAKLILKGKIKSQGVKMPVTKDIYIPVLNELKKFGIEFIEEIIN